MRMGRPDAGPASNFLLILMELVPSAGILVWGEVFVRKFLDYFHIGGGRFGKNQIKSVFCSFLCVLNSKKVFLKAWLDTIWYVVDYHFFSTAKLIVLPIVKNIVESLGLERFKHPNCKLNIIIDDAFGAEDAAGEKSLKFKNCTNIYNP